MNRPLGIGDFVASFKGDSPGHPFRGNQFEGGSDGDLNFEDIHGDPKTWPASKTDNLGTRMLRGMGLDVGTDGKGHITAIGNKDEYLKVKSSFPDTVLLKKFESRIGTRYTAFVDVNKKVNKSVVVDFAKREYETSSRD